MPGGLNVTDYSYNMLSQRNGIIQQGNPGASSMDYDANGNLIDLTDANGRTISYGYDELDPMQLLAYLSLHLVISPLIWISGLLYLFYLL